ncbi:uncharacterized protein PITG_15399 [Phytophthora infestans T30-4]|uniref:GAF domain-containing protein n=1 Tax=Phytophthora infestans (strain T30-4) TaxID=403677 RepID=D0NR58_PHYIT|nr:uncharacterized protein PITG_15399 [Phytophthora infestans T30-4]EEY63180.1 conserved hypothetical protein [Phytophthora infestans T30-4]|eukprot:XP_002898357.1 conserved hypothetical protein [Phytophthora infestans T30-4]
MSLDTPVIHRRPSTRLLELCTNRSTMDTIMVVSSSLRFVFEQAGQSLLCGMRAPIRARHSVAARDEVSTPSSVCTFDTSSTAASESSRFSDSPSSQKLGDLLTQVVCDDSDQVALAQRRAAFLVLEQLLLIDQKQDQSQTDMNANLLNAASDRQQPTEAAKRAMDISKRPTELDACKFRECRLPSVSDDAGSCPERRRVKGGGARADYLPHSSERGEMKAPHSVVTLVERDVVTLLATNAPEYWDVGTGNPREQTFCQHFVMDDKPLLVRHAEADMRFYHIAPVTMRSLRFYAGFPVSIPCVSRASGQPERVVIGALCCLDEKPHEMTRSQYWKLMKLAEAASAILEKTATEYIADPENHPLGQQRTGVLKPKGNGTGMVTC